MSLKAATTPLIDPNHKSKITNPINPKAHFLTEIGKKDDNKNNKNINRN